MVLDRIEWYRRIYDMCEWLWLVYWKFIADPIVLQHKRVDRSSKKDIFFFGGGFGVRKWHVNWRVDREYDFG